MDLFENVGIGIDVYLRLGIDVWYRYGYDFWVSVSGISIGIMVSMEHYKTQRNSTLKQLALELDKVAKNSQPTTTTNFSATSRPAQILNRHALDQPDNLITYN